MPRLLIACFATAAALLAQTNPLAKPMEYSNAVEDKNFYILSLIERTPDVRAAIRNDPALASITKARLAALDESTKSCADIHCYARATKWTAADTDSAKQGLIALCNSSPALRDLAAKIRASGMYVRYNGAPDGEFLGDAWDLAVNSMNHVIDVYARGIAPRYPAIDSATYDPTKPAGARTVATLAAVIQDDASSLDLFFEPALRFALGLLDLNHRNDAGRFEPMDKGVNAAAFQKIAATTDWSRYPYSVIVVPGAGNDQPGIALSGNGKLRVQLAAKRYRDGKAPFILVSGGFVHPNQTPYAEAIEMKRELMEKYGIPERAILVDPHARHTTTNIRNAARIMYRYGMPFAMKALITTDPGQSASIENPNFEQRCINELGYVPHKLLGRVSAFDLEWVPLIDALESDPGDPLDP